MVYARQQAARVQQAEWLFERAYLRARVLGWLARLTRHSRQMPLLDDVEEHAAHIDAAPPTLAPVRLGQIIGTHGKLSYDCDFLPTQHRSKARWVGVAAAMMTSAVDLPPVSLVQVGDAFYVNDGHHRVSAAKVMRHLFIDATVTRWHVTWRDTPPADVPATARANADPAGGTTP